MSIEMLPEDVRNKYEVHEWRHAIAILKLDYPQEYEDIIKVLRDFTLYKSFIMTKGGRKSPIAKDLDARFTLLGWEEKAFDTTFSVDGINYDSPTHQVDCFKNEIALEVEWSNKDPFYDRDLNNFRLLFDLRAASVGVIITKSDTLKPIVKGLGKKIWNKFGASTTWMSKLLPRINGGGGGGCPLLVFGISDNCYRVDS